MRCNSALLYSLASGPECEAGTWNLSVQAQLPRLVQAQGCGICVGGFRVSTALCGLPVLKGSSQKRGRIVIYMDR